MEKEAQEIRKRIINGFSISRIPDKEKKWFIEFAEKEFCDDRGMALKFLINSYTGLISSGVEHLEEAIQAIATELEELRQEVRQLKESKEQKKEIRSLDGKKVLNR